MTDTPAERHDLRRRLEAARDEELTALRQALQRKRGLPRPSGPAPAGADAEPLFGDSQLPEPSLGEPGGGADLKAKIDEIERAMQGAGDRPEAGTAQASLPGFASRAEAPTRTDADSGPPTEVHPATRAMAPATALAGEPATVINAPTVFEPTQVLSESERLALDAVTAPRPVALPAHEPLTAADPWLSDLMMGWSRGEAAVVLPALQSLVARQGPRAQHPPTWLCLFDSLRSSRQQAVFDDLATAWRERFGVAAPLWELPEPAAEGGSLLRLEGIVEGDLSPVLQGWECSATAPAPELRAPGRPPQEHRVDCRGVVRIDFLAAGDLYNWAVSRRAQGVGLRLLGLPRLVALFLEAVGLPDVASLELA